MILAAALSIQDVRERPTDKEAEAAELHARFADPDSDFLSVLNLWRYLETEQRAAVVERVPAHVPRRVPPPPPGARVAGPRPPAPPGRQRPRACAATGEPASADQIHRVAAGRAAVARRHVRPHHPRPRRRPPGPLRHRPRLGAAPQAPGAGSWPASWSRPTACGPAWSPASTRVDRAAGRPPREAQPTASRGGTPAAARRMTTERVTLYGLPIVDGRRVQLGRVDPALARHAVHPARPRRRRLAHPPRVRRPQPARSSTRCEAWRTAPAAATCSSATRPAGRLLRRPGRPPT